MKRPQKTMPRYLRFRPVPPEPMTEDELDELSVLTWKLMLLPSETTPAERLRRRTLAARKWANKEYPGKVEAWEQDRKDWAHLRRIGAPLPWHLFDEKPPTA